MSQSIKLTMAWLWTCPKCGFENSHRGNKIDESALPPDTEPVDEDGNPLNLEEFVMQPSVVWCRRCEERYDVQD